MKCHVTAALPCGFVCLREARLVELGRPSHPATPPQRFFPPRLGEPALPLPFNHVTSALPRQAASRETKQEACAQQACIINKVRGGGGVFINGASRLPALPDNLFFFY